MEQISNCEEQNRVDNGVGSTDETLLETENTIEVKVNVHTFGII